MLVFVKLDADFSPVCTLGHASVAITLDTYSHMLPGMGSEAADAMREVLG
jgi:hypothetical protein